MTVDSQERLGALEALRFWLWLEECVQENRKAGWEAEQQGKRTAARFEALELTYLEALQHLDRALLADGPKLGRRLRRAGLTTKSTRRFETWLSEQGIDPTAASKEIAAAWTAIRTRYQGHLARAEPDTEEAPAPSTTSVTLSGVHLLDYWVELEAWNRRAMLEWSTRSGSRRSIKNEVKSVEYILGLVTSVVAPDQRARPADAFSAILARGLDHAQAVRLSRDLRHAVTHMEHYLAHGCPSYWDTDDIEDNLEVYRPASRRFHALLGVTVEDMEAFAPVPPEQ